MATRSLPRQRSLAPGDVPRSAPVALTPSLPDEELVRRALHGDAWAEEAIYRRYVALILGVSRRLLANNSDAEDVAQETFTAAFGAWAQLREPERLRHWLLQIAVSKVHRRFRRRKLLRALGFDERADDATLDVLARGDCSQETRMELYWLSKALDKLTTRDRVAWMLRHVEGLSLEEVASECDCSLATAKRRIASAGERIARHTRRSSP
ncbi:MAG: sigma-70 family RNA polymerase sigma factor [Polyangiaceae bacterium]